MKRTAFWICSEGYVVEADKSISRVRRFMPDIDTHLFYVSKNPRLVSAAHQTTVVPPASHGLWFLHSTEIMYYALTQIEGSLLYFDTDTYMIEQVYEIFEMLEHGFDFCAAHAPGRVTCKTVEPIPSVFPEFNIGVCGFANNPNTRAMVYRWFMQYSEYRDVYEENDQGPLRETLWNTHDISVATLTSEFNCRFPFGVALAYKAKVLHGRHPNLEAVAQSVNRVGGMRTWSLKDMN